MTKPFLITLFAFYFISVASAQEPANKRPEKIYKPDSLHSPHKAAMRSLIIPGWGQLYNHQVWKAPLTCTGLGLLASAWVYNQRLYKQFTSVAILVRLGSVPGPSSPYYSLYKKYKSAYDQYSGLHEDQLADLSGGFQRDRDLSILGIVGLWGINVIDAYIDAKFIRSYSMDNNLAFKVSPGLINGNVYAANGNTITPALKITFYIN